MYDIVLGRTKGDLEKFGKKGTVMIGKQYVQMGQTSSLSNPIHMDVARSHAVLVCGKRGCLTGETHIFTNKGYKKIKDFNEKKDKILSLNKEKKIFEWKDKVKLISYPIYKNEELFQIELEDGQLLTLTQEHPLLIYTKGHLNWKIASEIEKKDKIVSCYKLPHTKNNKESLRIARILGFILADGTMQIRTGKFKDGRGHIYTGRKARLRLINNDDEVLNQLKTDIEQEFNIKAKKYKKGKENCWIIETKHQKVIDKLNKLGVPLGKKSEIIRVPEIVWTSSNKFKKEFLKALFSCDGFVDKSGARIVYYSNSKKIISDINLLLGHFTIQSRIREKHTHYNGKSFLSYQLDITDYTSVKNFEKIGFYQKEKKDRIKKRKFHLVKKRKSTTYINEELFCQKIKTIKKIKGVEKVYDLRVPENHSFIANGVISHNSGKSYTMGSIAEGLIDVDPQIGKNLSFILLDTMGVYWAMKYPNKKEEDMLKDWNLVPKGFNVQIYVPGGFFQKYKEDGIPVDFPFYIQPKELSVEDWLNAFKLGTDDPVGVGIQRVMSIALEKEENFSIDNIIKITEKDPRIDEKTKLAVINRFENCKTWGIFSTKGTPIKEILQGGKVTVMDLSPYVAMPGGWEIKALTLGLIAKKIFVERMLVRKREELFDIINKTQIVKQEEIKEDLPMPWLVVDEAHEFLPSEGMAPSSQSLITILREGRQPGVSLILATQQPGKIHTDAITQSDIVVSHRITASFDLEALDKIFLSYESKGSKALFNMMPRVKGSAIIMDDKNERLFNMQVKPRVTWHGGEEPNAIREIKEEFSLD